MDRLRMICSLIIHLKDDVTNLELQKYLYFIQAASLMTTGNSAFPDQIEAWQYGPVVPRAYREFKYENEMLRQVTVNLDRETEEIVREIIREFSSDGAYELVERTHSYTSWLNAWNSRNPIITTQSIIACHREISEENNGLIF